MMEKVDIRALTMNGMFIAIVFIATYFIRFQLPIPAVGGLVHTGNIALFTIASVFGAKKGALSGAFGMGLFDIVSGWAIWAPGTFIVRGVMGFIIGYVFYKGNIENRHVMMNIGLAIFLSSIWMIGGYYIVEGLIYSNWIAPLSSIIGNITQITIGWVVAIPLYFTLRQISMFKRVV